MSCLLLRQVYSYPAIASSVQGSSSYQLAGYGVAHGSGVQSNPAAVGVQSGVANPAGVASPAQSYPSQQAGYGIAQAGVAQNYPAAAGVQSPAVVQSPAGIQSPALNVQPPADGSIRAHGNADHAGSVGTGDAAGNIAYLSCTDCSRGRRRK